MKPHLLTGSALQTYRRGYLDGDEGNYFPGGLDEKIYDAGYRAGKKFGCRRGEPWTLRNLLKLLKEAK